MHRLQMRLAILLLAWSGVALAEPAAPKISVDPAVHDFGTVPEGGDVRHRFKVKNLGGAPLEIKSVSATCGCTAAAPTEKLIGPGRSAEIEVKFDTRNRPGRNEKTITVASNDPKTPILNLMIKVAVEQQLAFEPAYTQVEGGNGASGTAETWLAGKLAARARPRVLTVDPAGPVTAKVIERKAGSSKQRGLQLIAGPGPIGQQGSTRVVVATGLAAPAQIEHIVLWKVSGNIQAPRSIHLDLGRPDQKESTFQVASRLPDFRLQAARVLEGPFQVTVLGSGPGTRSIKVGTTLAAAPTDFTRGKLVLESNDPLEPRKEITLSLSARRPSASP
jgi:hypothetical protein